MWRLVVEMIKKFKIFENIEYTKEIYIKDLWNKYVKELTILRINIRKKGSSILSDKALDNYVNDIMKDRISSFICDDLRKEILYKEIKVYKLKENKYVPFIKDLDIILRVKNVCNHNGIVIAVDPREVGFVKLDKNCKIVIVPKFQKFTKEDPYGEEEWEMNETVDVIRNKYNEIHIIINSVKEYEDIISFLKNHNFLWITSGELNKFTPDWVKKKEFNGKQCLVARIKNKELCNSPHTSDNDIMKALSVKDFKKKYTEIFSEFNKNAEKMRLLHIDDDPYNEEDWDINENLSEDIVDVNNRIFIRSLENELGSEGCLNYLRRNLIGKVVKFTSRGIYEVVKEDFKKGIIHEFRTFEFKVKDVTHKKDFTHEYYFIDENGDKYQAFSHSNIDWKSKKKIIRSPEDPYGEEDWELNENAASIINDPYYKICLTNARKCKSDSERYGAVLVRNGEILGEGYNRGIAHAKFKLDRILKQGYANHAEVEAMNDALSKGYDIDGSDIYVAGYFPKTGTLFFKTQFTCKLCIPYFKKFNIQHVFVPLPDRWNPRTIDECIEDSQLFKRGQIHKDRLKYLIGDYKIGLLKENLTYDNLIKKNRKDVDPYGEEQWDEISVGDVVNCIDPGKRSKLKRNVDYIVTWFDKDNWSDNDGLIKVKGSRTTWKKDRFIKKELKETFHSEIDPYGEENWNDSKKVRCKNDITTSNGKYWFFHSGKEYEIDREERGFIILKTKIMGHDVEYPIYSGDFNYYFDRINESFDELDPYGEEDWNDYLSMLDKSSKFVVIKPFSVSLNQDDGTINLKEGDIIHYLGKAIYRRQHYTRYIFTNKPEELDYDFDLELDDFKYIKNIEDIRESKKMETPNKIKAAEAFIKDTIKDTEWEGKVFIAGGFVRDEIMGIDPKDIDLLINEPDGGIKFAIWITKKLNIYKEDVNPVTYPRFGTAMFTLRKQKYQGVDISGIEVECVMPRKEKYTQGSRKPIVSQGTLKDDVDRRDFTVNSLLKDLTTGEILDLTGMGINDIKRGIIRTPLDPDVIFSEDPLRMLRAIRFAVKYNWTLPMFMIRSLKKNSKKLQYISAERIQDELNKMLLTARPDKAIRLLQITGLSKYIFPELDKLINLKQNKYHKYDAMRHSLEVLKNTPPDIITRLSGLLHDVGKSKTKEIIDGEVHFYRHEELGSYMARDIMKRLRYPKEIIDAVATSIENHMRIKDTKDDALISDRSLRKLRQDLGPHLQRTLDLIHADNISHSDWANMPNQISNVRRKYKELEEKDISAPSKPPLNGNDIIEILGIKPGPIVGQISKILSDMYLEDPSMSKEELTEVVKKAYHELR